MNFNPDDPLAGILSDGSDDSFFDDDILGKKKPLKNKVGTPKSEKKIALFELAGAQKVASNSNIKKDLIGNKIKSETFEELETKPFQTAKTIIPKEPFKNDFLDIKSKPNNELELLKSPAKSKVSTSVDKLDTISQLNETKNGPSKVTEKGKTSQSLLDDILGVPPSKSISSSQPSRPVTSAKNQNFDLDTFLGKSESKHSENSLKTVTQKQGINGENNKEKGKPNKKSDNDWLGVFHDNENEVQEDDDSGMPSWLSGGDSKKKKKVDKNRHKEPMKDNSTEEPTLNVSKQMNEMETQENQEKNQNPVVNELPNLSVTQPSNNVTAESAALYLQQQESQLMLALQLKAQEEKLIAMQSKFMIALTFIIW